MENRVLKEPVGMVAKGPEHRPQGRAAAGMMQGI